MAGDMYLKLPKLGEKRTADTFTMTNVQCVYAYHLKQTEVMKYNYAGILHTEAFKPLLLYY